MGVFRQFPYSNFHEMNMDEILKILKTLQEEWNATKTEWASYKDYIDNYFENLDVSQEVLDALRVLASTGELNTIIDPVIVTETTEWLTEHITLTEGVTVIDDTLSIQGAAADAKATGDAITVVKSEICDEILLTTSLDPGYMYAVPNAGGLIGRNISEILTENASSLYTQNLIDVSAYRPYRIKIVKNNIASSSTRGLGFCDVNGVINSWVRERELFTLNNLTGKYEGYLDITDDYLWLSLATSGLTEMEVYVVYSTAKEAVNENNCVFVDITGSDANDGTYASPFASVNKALKHSNNICILPGVYRQKIDLSNSYGGNIKISSYDANGRVIFEPRDTQLCNSAEAVPGYTNVKRASVTATFDIGNKWIFQENVADATTLISDSERLPLERGYEYRCSDTKIELCTSSVLADALTEIENATEYKWFYDSGNHILYFSCPDTVSTSKPIKASFGHSLFSNASRKHTLILCGIETKYMAINISETTQSQVIDCKASNVFGYGAFVYNRVLGSKFIRCEALENKE